MALTTRLALTLALILALTFGGYGVGEFTTLRRALLREVDRALLLRAEALAQRLQREGPVALEATRLGLDEGPLGASSFPEVFVEILGPEGQRVAHSYNLGRAQLPRIVPPPLGPITVTTPGDAPLRMLAVPVDRQGRRIATVVVAESLRLPQEWMGRALGQTMAVGFFMLVLAVAASTEVVRRGLAPLKQVVTVATAILKTGDFSRRVPSVASADIVGEVARDLNALLERVEGLLESQRRLLADTSHELRNPLTVLRMDLDMLGRELPAETRAEIAQEALAEATRMTRLVEDLLLMAETESVGVSRAPLRLDLLATEMVDRMAPLAAEKGLALALGRCDETMVEGDSDRLRQVLTNLLVNAIRYTPSGRIEVRLFRDPQRARLEVEDTGVGISAEHLPPLFDRFYRVEPDRNRAAGGTGLGLPVSKALVEAHGGTISVQSRVGVGSVFTVLLPLSENQA